MAQGTSRYCGKTLNRNERDISRQKVCKFSDFKIAFCAKMRNLFWRRSGKRFVRLHRMSDHPVCAARDAAQHFLTGAATPPLEEGSTRLTEASIAFPVRG